MIIIDQVLLIIDQVLENGSMMATVTDPEGNY